MKVKKTFTWIVEPQPIFYKEKFDFIISFSSFSEMLSRSDLS